MRLSDRKIKTTVALESEKYLADGLGLYVRVMPNGTKTFIFRYTYGRFRRKLALGTYPEMSLAQARAARLKQAQLLTAGEDPTATKRVAVKNKHDSLTVEQLGQRFYEDWLKKDGHYKDPEDAYARLKRDPISVLKNTLIMDVKPQHLTLVWNKMRDERKVNVAPKRTLALTKLMFAYAVRQHWIHSNPVTMMPKDVGGKEVSRNTHLLLPQVAEVLRVVDGEGIDWDPITRLYLKLIIATGKRPGEVASLEWAHINFERREWLNPKGLTKEGHGDHLVFLSDYAIGVLLQLKALNPESRWVFPVNASNGRRKKDLKPYFDPRTLSKAVRKSFLAGKFTTKWTPHDMRRTFSTRMADLGVQLHVTEKCLDHLMTGTMAVYNQASYFPERRAAIDLWGKTLQDLT